MSMFQWVPDDSSNDGVTQDGDSSRIVSHWFWLYWAITVPLTIGILIVWILWFNWTDRSYKDRQDRELDEETKIE